MIGTSILFSSAFFFLIWNILGTAALGLPHIGLPGILAVNLLCAPLELLVMGSIARSFFGPSKTSPVPKKNGL
jgi:hypothetical protein